MTDPAHPTHEGFTGKQVVGAAFALICALAAGFWTLHLALTDRLRDRIAAYEDAEKSELPEILKSIGSASDRLGKQLAQAQSIESITQRANALDQRARVLDSQLANANKNAEAMAGRIANLERELAEIHSDDLRFNLLEGESKTLAGNIPIGLASGSVIHECEVVVDNKSERLKPGAYVSVDLPSRSCRVIIEQCSSREASFHWVCTKRSRPAA